MNLKYVNGLANIADHDDLIHACTDSAQTVCPSTEGHRYNDTVVTKDSAVKSNLPL